mgnify:CR=1 FL=1
MVRTSTGAPGKAAWPQLPALEPARALARINIAGLLIDASTFSFSITLSCHAEHALGADYWALGKLGALSALFYSLTCLLTGGASDRLGSRPLVILSLAAISRLTRDETKLQMLADAPDAVAKMRELIMWSAFSGAFSAEDRNQPMPEEWAVEGPPIPDGLCTASHSIGMLSAVWVDTPGRTN